MNENRQHNGAAENRNYAAVEQSAESIRRYGFNRCVPNISFFDCQIEEYHSVQLNCGNLIESMSFYYEELSIPQIACIEITLSNVKFLEMFGSAVYGNFYDVFLKKCPKLRHLRLDSLFDNKWLLQKYPMLERFEVNAHGQHVDELAEFFKNHRIKRFGIDAASFWENVILIASSGAKFIELAINITDFDPRKADAVFDVLNQLYRQGVYQRLHIHVQWTVFESLHDLQALKSLYIWHEMTDRDRMLLNSNLEVLGIQEVGLGMDMNDVAICLNNLTQLFIHEGSWGNIIPFIRYSPKLERIKVTELNQTRPIDLELVAVLNRLRSECVDACKLTLYIGDFDDEIDFGLVKLESGGSFDPEHYFIEKYF